jgi:PIN domain nuclease of toxin-antitoxin system
VLLLLDTHVWLWAVEGDDRRVGRRTRRLLAQREAAGAIRVSPASVFEISALCASGRLRLARPVDQWIRGALDDAGVLVAPLTPAIALDAGYIPREGLGDPLDRLLVATARQMDATLVTCDARILDYASRTKSARTADGSA